MVGRFRVLVIDDDPGIREYLQALGERQGYQVSVGYGIWDVIFNDGFDDGTFGGWSTVLN